MTALAVFGFIFLNLVGLIFVPRFAIMIYIWYVLIRWDTVPNNDPVGIIALFLIVFTVLAVVADILLLISNIEFLKNKKNNQAGQQITEPVQTNSK